MTDHGTLWKSQRAGWNKEYSTPSPLWRGPSAIDVELGEKTTILELGCGDGKTLAGILGKERFVVGVDYSLNAVKSCLRRYRPHQSPNLIMSDVCALPFADNSFDVVIASHILEHLVAADRNQAVAECRRVLRSGGMAIVHVFSEHDMRYGKGREIERNTFVRGNSIMYHYFSKTELSDLFGDFRVKSIEEREVGKRFDGKDQRRVTLEAVFHLI
ncbi:MAG: class I SAM-dependent methyltransferase [Methanomassiliicoccales archaeon]|nr:class I SAM-dependent methyltransferase [Methanomassiliicoccales archaeon]